MAEEHGDKRHADALTVLMDAVQYAVNRLDSSESQPQVAGDLAVALAFCRDRQASPSNVEQITDDASPFGLVQRLRKEADKWSGTSCRSEEQFFLRDLIREAARMIEKRIVSAPSTTPQKPGETPRTEAMIESCGDYEKAYHYNGRFAEFARQLERELAEMTRIAFSSDPSDSVPSATPRKLEALRWASDTFGLIACDEQERAMRFAEEAAELVHAIGLERTVLEAIVARVYGRQAGEVAKEIGQAMLTLDLLGQVVGVDASEAGALEFERVQKIPKDEWDRRHRAKVAEGIAK